tara:strand:- start:2592 stop:3005 length:414 start_codon:yes stop_codon:yes gene_type:complete
MAATVAQVRQELADLQTASIADDIITQQLNLATQYVDDVKIANANATSIDYAVLTLAAYFTYDLYTTAVSRTLSAAPSLSIAKADRMMRKAEMYINMIAKERISLKEDLPSPMAPVASMVPTIIEDIVVDEQAALST